MTKLPPQLVHVRDAALNAISPIRPVDDATVAEKDFLFTSKRTRAGDDLPPYFLIYFLFVDLLGFKNLGRFEKVAWSIPIDYEGRAFLIEHRKFGVGVFAHDPAREQGDAQQIVCLIKKGVRAAEAYFEWIAETAARNSKLNVENKSAELFSRFRYFADAHAEAAKVARERAGERYVETRQISESTVTSVRMPVFELRRNARWLALAAVDAFFSWTEHVFIHIAILRGGVTTGVDVAELADAEWQEKFKRALDVSDRSTKVLFDQLIELRRQTRNLLAHGAFGKQGEAFSFHSGAGAVPLLLPHKAGKKRYSISADLSMEDAKAFEVIAHFIQHLWTGEREPAYHYIQESGLPLVLTHAQDGTYARAMQSVEAMKEFLDYQSHLWDQAANMDW
jgi:hypothetical protein